VPQTEKEPLSDIAEKLGEQFPTFRNIRGYQLAVIIENRKPFPTAR